MTVKTVSLDLAKDIFQVHGISESGRVGSVRAKSLEAVRAVS